MVAVPQTQPAPQEHSSATGAFELIQGSLSAKRVARRSPLLAGLHRAADGSLIGVFTAVLALSGLTLHWQYRWTVAFERLEDTRAVGHRLTESTAILERYPLAPTPTPKSKVPTTAETLVYHTPPSEDAAGGSNANRACIGALGDTSNHLEYSAVASPPAAPAL